ncbi:hypothetical protein TcCL_ESM06632, partial [Trypanosoma cruzi]
MAMAAAFFMDVCLPSCCFFFFLALRFLAFFLCVLVADCGAASEERGEASAPWRGPLRAVVLFLLLLFSLPLLPFSFFFCRPRVAPRLLQRFPFFPHPLFPPSPRFREAAAGSNRRPQSFSTPRAAGQRRAPPGGGGTSPRGRRRAAGAPGARAGKTPYARGAAARKKTPAGPSTGTPSPGSAAARDDGGGNAGDTNGRGRRVQGAVGVAFSLEEGK